MWPVDAILVHKSTAVDHSGWSKLLLHVQGGGGSSPVEAGNMLWLIQRDFLEGKTVQQMVSEALLPVANPFEDQDIAQVCLNMLSGGSLVAAEISRTMSRIGCLSSWNAPKHGITHGVEWRAQQGGRGGGGRFQVQQAASSLASCHWSVCTIPSSRQSLF